MQTVHLSIDGMHCGACVRRVNQALNKVAGAEVRSVQVGTAEVAYDPSRTNENEIVHAVETAGYAAHADRS